LILTLLIQDNFNALTTLYMDLLQFHQFNDINQFFRHCLIFFFFIVVNLVCDLLKSELMTKFIYFFLMNVIIKFYFKHF